MNDAPLFELIVVGGTLATCGLAILLYVRCRLRELRSGTRGEDLSLYGDAYTNGPSERDSGAEVSRDDRGGTGPRYGRLIAWTYTD